MQSGKFTYTLHTSADDFIHVRTYDETPWSPPDYLGDVNWVPVWDPEEINWDLKSDFQDLHACFCDPSLMEFWQPWILLSHRKIWVKKTANFKKRQQVHQFWADKMLSTPAPVNQLRFLIT